MTLEDLPDEQWERLADYVRRVAWLAFVQAYFAGHHDKGTKFEQTPSQRADDYTRSGFDADTVREYCLSNFTAPPIAVSDPQIHD